MKKYDNVDINEIRLFVSEEEFAQAKEKVSAEFKEAVKKACDNLLDFTKDNYCQVLRKNMKMALCWNANTYRLTALPLLFTEITILRWLKNYYLAK